MSFDGTPSAHDRHRIQVNGGGTSAALVPKLKEVLAWIFGVDDGQESLTGVGGCSIIILLKFCMERIVEFVATLTRMKKVLRAVIFCVSSLIFSSLLAQSGYTNHAENVVVGWPIALTATQVTLENRVTTNQSIKATYPLSIFPESEQRRIAADFGQPRVPVAVKRAIEGAEKAMARSRKRAEKGLCTKEESEAFCAKSETALRSYLDKQVKAGIITPAERKCVRLGL